MNEIIFVIGIIIFIISLYLIKYFINSRNKKDIQKNKGKEYQCIICNKKYVTSNLVSMDNGKHQLCSDKCIYRYMTSGFKEIVR